MWKSAHERGPETTCMSDDQAPAFVDTNVLVYAFEKSRSPRQATASELVSRLMDENRLRLSTQVFQELFVTLTRKVARPSTPEETLALLDDLAAWPVFVIDYPSIRDAGLLGRDQRISFWDALIVVGAARSGVGRLFTEDLTHGQRILGIEIVNPFR